MTEATVTGLVEDLNLGLQDTSRVAQEFQEIVDLLTKLGYWVEVTLMTATQGTALYALPTNALELLTAFYDDRQLDRESAEDLEPNWRDHVGQPLAYVEDYLADRTFELYPKPDMTSKTMSIVYAEPLGRDYPPGTVVVLTTFRRTTFQPWFSMLMALEISALEFAREGRQRDMAYSAACRAVSGLVKEYLA